MLPSRRAGLVSRWQKRQERQGKGEISHFGEGERRKRFRIEAWLGGGFGVFFVWFFGGCFWVVFVFFGGVLGNHVPF